MLRLCRQYPIDVGALRIGASTPGHKLQKKSVGNLSLSAHAMFLCHGRALPRTRVRYTPCRSRCSMKASVLLLLTFLPLGCNRHGQGMESPPSSKPIAASPTVRSAKPFDWGKDTVQLDCTPQQTARWDQSEKDRLANLKPAVIHADPKKQPNLWWQRFPEVCTQKEYAQRFPSKSRN